MFTGNTLLAIKKVQVAVSGHQSTSLEVYLKANKSELTQEIIRKENL